MHSRRFGFLFAVVALALAGGMLLLKQREQTYRLRGELEAARAASIELERLREKNAQLRERQIPATELEALRADHAALARLRSELDAMGKTK